MANVIRAVVRGDKFQAAAAAAERRIPFAHVSESRGAAGLVMSCGDVGPQHADRLAAWFRETDWVEWAQTLPVGALMWYD